MPKLENREYRDIPTLECRQAEEGQQSYMVEGYASTFGEYRLFSDGDVEVYERIAPNAFDDTDMSDVIFQKDHTGSVLARTRNNTVQLSIDDHGLFVRADLSKSEASREMYNEISTGLYDRMSFAFTVDDDELVKDSDTKYTRIVNRIGKLYDVSAVSFPANPGTEINASFRDRFHGFMEAQLELAEQKEEERKEPEIIDVESLSVKDIEERLATLPEDDPNRNLLEIRKQEIAEYQERKANAEALNNGEIHASVVEKDKKMEEIRTFAVDTVEYRDAYFKQLMGKSMEVEERAALSSAASVIPTETLNKIYGKLDESPLLSKVNALHIPGYVAVPKATTVNDANWVAIGTAATDSADLVGSISLTAKKLIKTIEITADIQAMSIPAFQGWLVDKLAAKMERAICAAILSGTGTTTTPTGVTKAVTASSITAVSKDNLLALMASVKSAYHNGACWVMTSEMFYTKVAALANDSNGILIMGGIRPVLYGHEVVFDDAAGSNVFFGNFNAGYVFNYGEGIAIEADQSVAFRSGSTVYRAMALCDGAVADTEAFAYATIA